MPTPYQHLRLGYFGDGAWARRGLELILADPHLEVAFVCPRHPRPDRELVDMARSAGLPVESWPDVNQPQALEAIAAYRCHLLVSMSFDQILRRPILESTPLGFINCHAGELPFYRGRNVLNWALINGEDHFGVTVHFVDTGIDTGDIILQERIPLSPQDDYAGALAKATEACPRLLHQAIDLLRRGQAKPIPQHTIHPVGTYFCRRRPGDEYLDWSWPSARLLDFIRALAHPGPGARTWHGQQELVIRQAQAIPQAPAYLATPGEVVGRTPQGVVVKTGDTTILVTKAAPPGAEPQTPRLPLGTRLGRDPWQEITRLQNELQALKRKLDQRG